MGKWICEECKAINPELRSWCHDCGADVPQPTFLTAGSSTVSGTDSKIVNQYLSKSQFERVKEESKTLQVKEPKMANNNRATYYNAPQTEEQYKPHYHEDKSGPITRRLHEEPKVQPAYKVGANASMTYHERFKKIADFLNDSQGKELTTRDIMISYVARPTTSDQVTTGVILNILSFMGYVTKTDKGNKSLSYRLQTEIPVVR